MTNTQRMPNTQCPSSAPRYLRQLDVVIGHLGLVIHWSLAIGHGSFDFGHWTLDLGLRTLDLGLTSPPDPCQSRAGGNGAHWGTAFPRSAAVDPGRRAW